MAPLRERDIAQRRSCHQPEQRGIIVDSAALSFDGRFKDRVYVTQPLNNLARRLAAMLALQRRDLSPNRAHAVGVDARQPGSAALTRLRLWRSDIGRIANLAVRVNHVIDLAKPAVVRHRNDITDLDTARVCGEPQRFGDRRERV